MTRLRLALGGALAAASFMALAPSAHAILQYEERTEASRTTTFEGLIVTDISGVDDRITIVPDLLGGPSRMVITSSTGTANTPAGCEPILLPGSISCPIGEYHFVAIEAGAGDDSVEIGVAHPSLTRRQIGSEEHFVYFNAILGSGADDFESSGPGTDYVQGDSGRDLIRAGPSNDVLSGGGGTDNLFGDGGLDALFGEKGRDLLVGGGGVPDLHRGGRGRDRCVLAPRDLVAGCERLRLGR